MLRSPVRRVQARRCSRGSFRTFCRSTSDDILEITGIHSVVGLLDGALMTEPPFRARIIPRVCFYDWRRNKSETEEVTLAHKGVLFLDEFPEFEKRVLEGSSPASRRQHYAPISRARGSAIFPQFYFSCRHESLPLRKQGQQRQSLHLQTKRFGKIRAPNFPDRLLTVLICG